MLARLREESAPDGVTLPDLARQLGGNADVEPHRLQEVVEGLERNGLARVADASEWPETHPAVAVAEERAPYSTGAEGGGPGEIRVTLP